MKGYLRSAEGLFQLAPKVTTVGRQGCDLVIETPGIDFQHAVIEYSENEECFVLQDLNTREGTYVNECRVQNAAVRLAPGDIIRFGYSGMPYELDIESPSQVSYPPVQQRPAWTQPLTVIHTEPAQQPILMGCEELPKLQAVYSTMTSQWGHQQGQSAAPPLPRPPQTLRQRPLSAGAATRRTTYSTAGSQARPVSGWVSGRANSARAAPSPTLQQPVVDFTALQDKEQKILRLTEEVRRLSIYENECHRKDQMIQQLRDEIENLQGRIRQLETSRSPNLVSSDPDVTQKLMQLENEVSMKRMEVQSLKEQINRMRSEDVQLGSISRQDMNDRVVEINSLRTELERVKKDKNITSGLVTQMQRDMANKDTTISRLTREIENLKTETKEKDVSITSLRSKFQRTQDNRKTDEEIEAKENELAGLRIKFKSTENRVQEQAELITSLKEEMEKEKKTAANEKEAQRKLQAELDQSKAKCQDFERAERLVRIDLEQSSKRMERFRTRVVQVTFSTPGIRAPDKELNDDELLEALKNLIDERTDLSRQQKDLKDKLTRSNAAKKDFLDNSKKLKQHLNESVARLKDRGQLYNRIKQEVDLVQTISLDDSVSWVRTVVLEFLQIQMAWEMDIESALEECGINIKISDETPAQHIRNMRSQWQVAINESHSLRTMLESNEQKYLQDQESAIQRLRQELEEQNKLILEKSKLESEENLNRTIDEIKALEEETREGLVAAEQAKIAELEAHIEQLKTAMLDKESEDNSTKEAIREALEQVEMYKSLESELRQKISELESGQSEEAENLRKQLEEKDQGLEAESDGYKEQIRQHSVTICAMEERLNKVMKRNKDYQAEITHLRNTITELRKKPAPQAPKPKVIVQKPPPEVVAMEATLMQIQRENADLKRQLQEQQDVITGLRRDLSGTSARLTDMTGELSESQKEEIERNKNLLRQQDVELIELRQQMAKLSQIIDKQSQEIRELNSDISKQKAQLVKFKSATNDKDDQIQNLQNKLAAEQQESQKHLSLIEDEGRITSELTAMGAQCRGERHSTVISRQREALTELRARIKSLEQQRPPLPTQDQALQQVVMLNRELTELRAGQNQQDTQVNAVDSTLDQQIYKARGLESQARADAEVERGAHRETMDALEMSENAYLPFLRGVASALEMDEVGGLRSMAHIPKDERERLAMERAQACEVLCSRIKVLKERILRKDELLQGYERDLAKLRQAETLADQKQAQVESLAEDIRSRTEESQYLRESLQRTREKLDQESRINGAIKQKKSYHLENERVSRNGWPKHHCPPDDIRGKAVAKKKAASERIKRQNYEIEALKGELGTKDRHLQNTRRKLVTLESNLGLEKDRDPLATPTVGTF